MKQYEIVDTQGNRTHIVINAHSELEACSIIAKLMEYRSIPVDRSYNAVEV